MVPSFPASFHKGKETWDFNFPAMLLMIGYLTTPTSTTGVSLSEFWAWVRYLAAIKPDADLRLAQSFSDLDPHQKTILSDDFGMGVPMLWLSERLALNSIVDGRYFLDKFSASVGAHQKYSSKRGPSKTPDFVARDESGVWHVIECKGTQSGPKYSAKQLGNNGPPPSGGVAQKKSIIFPPAYTGQRLVSGLQIGVETGEPSRLVIVDPEPHQPFEIGADDLEFANDAASRGVVSKALRLAGFETAAEAIASPFGTTPSSVRYTSKRQEDSRQKTVEERNMRAREDLERAKERTPLFDGQFRGRERSFDLPRSIFVGDYEVNKVIVKQGVKQDVLEEMSERPTIEEPIQSADVSWEGEIDRNIVSGEGRAAKMKIGGLFRSEVFLE